VADVEEFGLPNAEERNQLAGLTIKTRRIQIELTTCGGFPAPSLTVEVPIHG
jgi:hypothetical protein